MTQAPTDTPLHPWPECNPDAPIPPGVSKERIPPFTWYNMTFGLAERCDYDMGWVTVAPDRTVYAIAPRYSHFTRALYVGCPGSTPFWNIGDPSSPHVSGLNAAALNSDTVFKVDTSGFMILISNAQYSVFRAPTGYLYTSVAVGEESLWATTRDNHVVVADLGPVLEGGTPAWERVGSIASPRRVAVGRRYMADDVWVLGGDGKVWTLCPGAPQPWLQVPGPNNAFLVQLDVGQDGTVMAVSKDGGLFEFVYSGQGQGSWNKIPRTAGAMDVISVCTRKLMWGNDRSCQYWMIVRDS